MKNFYLSLGLLATLASPLAFAENRTMTIQHLTGATSYFSISVQDDGLLKGTYPGWCVDWATRIEDNTVYNAKFYSSLSEHLPAGVVDKPEHLDEANWLLNQHMVGESSPGGYGIYTSGDMQLALWTLLDDHFQSDTVGPFDQRRVDELVAAALEEDGFVPSCKQIVGVILDPSLPNGENGQTTITEVPRNHFPKCAVPEGDE
ncbi:hypothetical protein ACJVC5_16170 [Peredibacter sp. HCB2-198]|uniref:hypothetical protein n=1 Tax=Peredibacter sp. HCB2-198 TaxID=3383025 RepID=UPI0038B4E330